MQYIMKSGVLYKGDNHIVCASVKSMLIGPAKKICKGTGEMLLEANIRQLDEAAEHNGDVRYREYVLIDDKGNAAVSAFPGYAEGEDPGMEGWPICRMPRVDHANVTIDGAGYLLTMHNSQNYTMRNIENAEVLRIMHKGIAGGWTVEDICGFVPEIICGIFIFCRYIEQENEFLIV